MTGFPARALRFLWFGSYAKGPGYPRSETLVDGLRSLSHSVRELHAPLFDGAGERVSAGRGAGLTRSAWRQGRAAVSLGSRFFREPDHDVVVVGAGGVIDGPLLRLLQNFERRPLVLDAFVPLYDAVVRDRKLAPADSLRARTLLAVERLGARGADLVLADTDENAALLIEDLGLDAERVAVVPVSQHDPGAPTPVPGDGPLRVLLVATYIPLHGVETVLDAARRIGGDGIEVTIVGTGQGFEAAREVADDIPGLTLVPEFLPLEDVLSRLADSHVGLGIFGETAKAARVVPLKAALTLAAGRTLVTRDSPAARSALDGAAVLVPPGDPDALADALLALRDDRDRVARLAAAGRQRYEQRFSPPAVARTLLRVLENRGLTR